MWRFDTSSMSVADDVLLVLIECLDNSKSAILLYIRMVSGDVGITDRLWRRSGAGWVPGVQGWGFARCRCEEGDWGESRLSAVAR